VTARGKSRKRALDILFEAEVRSVAIPDVLGERIGSAHPPLNEYVSTLVEGVVARKSEIDQLLAANTGDWPLERMPIVDRNVARIAVYELLAGQVPTGVVLSEAVELVSDLSTDESPKFLNGLLARIAQTLPESVATTNELD